MRTINSFFYLFFSLYLLSCQTQAETEGISALGKPAIDLEATKAKAKEALKFCTSNKMNTEFCILIDMGLHSGVKRFIVWDLDTETILYSFLVSHGCCDNSWNRDETKSNPGFSNLDGSHCTSMGKYKIGERGYSNWGVHVKYLLHGLESTNNQAFRRTIVFHSWEAVSDDEVYPNGTAEGWGCPAISNNSFKKIDPYLKNSSKPVLMWIYD